MKDFLWRMGQMGLAYGGPVLIVLGALWLVVTMLANSLSDDPSDKLSYWPPGLMIVAGVVLLVVLFTYFRGFSKL